MIPFINMLLGLCVLLLLLIMSLCIALHDTDSVMYKLVVCVYRMQDMISSFLQLPMHIASFTTSIIVT